MLEYRFIYPVVFIFFSSDLNLVFWKWTQFGLECIQSNKDVPCFFQIGSDRIFYLDFWRWTNFFSSDWINFSMLISEDGRILIWNLSKNPTLKPVIPTLISEDGLVWNISNRTGHSKLDNLFNLDLSNLPTSDFGFWNQSNLPTGNSGEIYSFFHGLDRINFSAFISEDWLYLVWTKSNLPSFGYQKCFILFEPQQSEHTMNISAFSL